MSERIQKIIEKQQKIFKVFKKMIEQLSNQNDELLLIYDESKAKIKEYQNNAENTLYLMEQNNKQIEKLKQLVGEE